MKRCILLCGSVLMLGLIGCTPQNYIIRSRDQKPLEAKTIVLLPPKATVYEVDAAGNPEKKDEWSAKAVVNLQRGTMTALSKK